MTPFLKFIYYEFRANNPSLEGTAFRVGIIRLYYNWKSIATASSSHTIETFTRVLFLKSLTLYFYFHTHSGSNHLPLFISKSPHDVVQLQGKLFMLSKMLLLSNVFVTYWWLNILDQLRSITTTNDLQVLDPCLFMLVINFWSFISFLISGPSNVTFFELFNVHTRKCFPYVFKARTFYI